MKLAGQIRKITENGTSSKRIPSDMHRRSAFDMLGGLDGFTGQRGFFEICCICFPAWPEIMTNGFPKTKRICRGFGFMKLPGAPVKCPASANTRETWP